MRYKLKMINKNGYTIEKESNSIVTLKHFASFYPLSVFFGWIYDSKNDEMIFQNNYSSNWKKCTNETFIPYWC